MASNYLGSQTEMGLEMTPPAESGKFVQTPTDSTDTEATLVTATHSCAYRKYPGNFQVLKSEDSSQSKPRTLQPYACSRKSAGRGLRRKAHACTSMDE